MTHKNCIINLKKSKTTAICSTVTYAVMHVSQIASVSCFVGMKSSLFPFPIAVACKHSQVFENEQKTCKLKNVLGSRKLIG